MQQIRRTVEQRERASFTETRDARPAAGYLAIAFGLNAGSGYEETHSRLSPALNGGRRRKNGGVARRERERCARRHASRPLTPAYARTHRRCVGKHEKQDVPRREDIAKRTPRNHWGRFTSDVTREAAITRV